MAFAGVWEGISILLFGRFSHICRAVEEVCRWSIEMGLVLDLTASLFSETMSW
jgi:hypothetical protein